jgi:CxxC motif-containing protein (DUF1111 family)
MAGDAVAQTPRDPGVRTGAAGAGGPIAGLDNQKSEFFQTGLDTFKKVDDVALGLGPRFNLDSCAGCHAQPSVGGTSPSINPQIATATANGNTIPSFIQRDGPVREARFVSDGGVHDLFVIAGRSDAPGCAIKQPNFDSEIARNNVTFRIPTPVFGAGLVENTPDQNLMDAVAGVAARRSALGISGNFNYSGNDGTITRFGWKAQNKSLMIFSGEAYNVEMGVTNELFPSEREYAPSCQYNTLPEDVTNIKNGQASSSASDVDLFATFMRLLAAPAPASRTSSTIRGQAVFGNIGCDLCHIPQQTTGPSGITGLSAVTYSPYSDFQVHNMGNGLEDQITQGAAAGNEFRTAPLWGVGQRIFFLHDGSTKDLLQAILQHGSDGSEANGVIANFEALSADDQQNLLNFLRSL